MNAIKSWALAILVWFISFAVFNFISAFLLTSMRNTDMIGGMYIGLALMAIQWILPFYVAYKVYKHIHA